MRWRWIAAALLGGLICVAWTGGAAAWAPQVGPEWVSAEGSNPALVTFQGSDSRGRAGLAVDWLSPDPLTLTMRTFCTLPDTGEGAAALVVSSQRTFYADSTDRTASYSYSLGRRLNPHWAAGVGGRFLQRSAEVAYLGTTPDERTLGLELGALYLPDERTWVGAAVHNALGTTYFAAGNSRTETATYSLNAGRQLTPTFKLALDATGLAPGATASVGLNGQLALGGWAIRTGAAYGREPNWTVGLTTGGGNVVLEAAIQGTETRIGGALGVTAQW